MAHPLIQFFAYRHLKLELQTFSAPFGEMAELVDRLLPDGAEKTVCLRKLLEAKDCAVRSVLYKEPDRSGPDVHATR